MGRILSYFPMVILLSAQNAAGNGLQQLADIVFLYFCKGLGQRTDYVAQSAGNGEGEGFGGGE